MQYSRAALPWTTVAPSALSALDLNDISSRDFRPTMWWDRSDVIFEQAQENDAAFLAYLMRQDTTQFDMTQPVIKWRVGRPADLWTTNAKAVAAADTYISLTDPLVTPLGFELHFSDYSTVFRVVGIDTDLGEGWVNGATDACNIKVERLTGPSVIIPVGTIGESGAPLMSEIGTPHQGTTTTPGDPVYNNITLTGIYGSISTLQMESDMIGDWGTHPKVRKDIYHQYLLRKQQSLLFDYRYTGTDSQVSNSQLYVSNGVVPQIKTNVMEAGSLGVNMDGVKLNDFFENLFNSELSGPTKEGFCGSAFFRDARLALASSGIEVEMLKIQTGAQNAMALGANAFTFQTQSGKTIQINELRKAFGAKSKTDWCVVLDSTNVGYGRYPNISERWYDNIEDPTQAITLISDALVDTFVACLKDESTCGVIRGGSRGIVER